MSFYQPSLSLYDIIDALSTRAQFDRNRQQQQAALRQQQEQQYQQRQQQRRRAVASQSARHHGHAKRQNNGPYISPAYYYSIQPDESYYNPFYYRPDEENESFSYNHAPQNPDYLTEILNALTGAGPLAGEVFKEPESEEDQGLQREVQPDAVFDSQGSAPEGREEAEDPSDSLAEALKEAVDRVKGEEEPEQEEKTTNETKAEESGPQNLPESQKTNFHPFAHPQAPSPIPDPLQVSKPEIRLDLPFSPEVNVYDSPEQYTVVLALPGANSKSFKIDYHPSSHELLVKGKVENKIDVDQKYVKISELKYGAFERSVKFPVLPRIRDEAIKATYSNGLLQVKVPKVLNDDSKPQPKRRIVIEDVPDEELLFEENPNPEQRL